MLSSKTNALLTHTLAFFLEEASLFIYTDADPLSVGLLGTS